MRIRWLKRFRPPVLLAALGIAIFALPHLARQYFEDFPPFDRASVITGTVVLTLAFGWLISTFVDGLIKRRLAHLKLDVADNLAARKSATRLDVVRRVWVVGAGFLTLSVALMAIPSVRQIGVTLFASAGIAGIALGLAARPMLGNLIAGLQIAFTQPIRIDDAVVIENEWGWVEEIGLFYVVIRLWDWRRLVVPLSYFIEKPFQNWTRDSASIIGSVFWSVDYRAPVGAIRQKLQEICAASKLWDGEIVNLQVTEAQGTSVTLRALASANTSPEAWDLRCHIREEMITWLQTEHPEALPIVRASAVMTPGEPVKE